MPRIKFLAVAVVLSFLSLLGGIRSAAATKPEHLVAFDPAKGFQPAQTDLVAVYLQIAGSLEAYSSPEPYLRHMQAEHQRIETKYQQQTGEKLRRLCPAYMDEAYIAQSTANWKRLAPQLKLEELAKSTGQWIRLAIKGPDDQGTILADVFHQHQQQVHAALTSKQDAPASGFDVLQASILKCLRLDATPAEVNALPAPEQAVAAPAHDIQAALQKRFAALDAGLSAADAAKVKSVLLAIVTDVGRMAESEMQAASLEQSLDDLRTPQTPYTIEEETALNADDRKTFAAFLKKPRFTKADFPALDKFYGGPYDKLTERGKDEMSKRIDAGMRHAH